MARNPDEYQNAVDGLTGLTPVSNPPGYQHLQVYEGELRADGTTKPVELRAIPAENASDALGDQFLRAGRNWRNFATHPNVIELLDWGESPTPWILVEAGYDESLGTVAGTLDGNAMCDAISEVGEALRNAALYNTVHGNLHPSYVHFTVDSPVQVDDWGLERLVGTHVSGEFLTPYTAPEQIDETMHSSGAAIDSYGLAALAYFVLTGRPPVSPSREAISNTEPQPPSSFVDVAEPVDRFFQDALAKDPNRRPDGPYSVATQLRQVIEESGSGYTGQAAGAAGAQEASTQLGQSSQQQPDPAQPQQPGPTQPQQHPPNQHPPTHSQQQPDGAQSGQQTAAHPSQQAGGPQPGHHQTGGQPGQQPGGTQPRQQAGTAGERARHQPEHLSDRTSERRRTVLKAGIGAGLLGLLGFGAYQFLDDGTTGSAVLDTVPPKADSVAHTDAAALLSNSEFRDAIDQQLANQPDSGYGSLADLLDDVQATTGIDFREVEGVTGFWGTADSSTNYAAMVVQTPADESTVREHLENEDVVESESQYRERPLYLLSSEAFIWDLYLSHLGDGEYVLGTRQEIEDVIDVREGDLDPVEDDVRDAYQQSGEELVRWGFIVPSGLVGELDSLPGATQLVADLDAGYGTIKEDPAGEFRLTVQTASESVAGDLESQLNTLVMLATNQLESTDAVDLSEATAQQLQGVIDDLETETDGADVIVTVPDGFRLVPIVLELVFQ